MRHPLVGAMTVTQTVLHSDRGRHVVVATTEAGSSSQVAMTLLAHSTRRTAGRVPARLPT